MKLSTKLKTKNIIPTLKSEDKSSVIQELLGRLLDLNYLTATIKLHSFIDGADKLMNAAVGRGVAYHYSTSIEIDEQLAVLGISQKGIQYNAPDGQKVHFILLILDTKDQSTSHRKLITRFQHFIHETNLRDQIIESNSAEDIVKVIIDWEEEHLLNEEI